MLGLRQWDRHHPTLSIYSRARACAAMHFMFWPPSPLLSSPLLFHLCSQQLQIKHTVTEAEIQKLKNKVNIWNLRSGRFQKSFRLIVLTKLPSPLFSWHPSRGRSSAGRRRRLSWRPASRRTRRGCWSWRATGSRRRPSVTPSMNTWRRRRPSTKLWRRSTTKPRSSSKTSSRSESTWHVVLMLICGWVMRDLCNMLSSLNIFLFVERFHHSCKERI